MKEKYANEEIFFYDIDNTYLLLKKLQVQDTNMKCLYPTHGYKIQM